MILEGEKSRRRCFRRAKLSLDATSGNTGIAYAMIGAARGYPVRLCLPRNVTPERKKILSAYGAEIVYTPPAEQSDGAIRMVKEALCRRILSCTFYPGSVRQRRTTGKRTI